jgi:hypothetical protein
MISSTYGEKRITVIMSTVTVGGVIVWDTIGLRMGTSGACTYPRIVCVYATRPHLAEQPAPPVPRAVSPPKHVEPGVDMTVPSLTLGFWSFEPL